MTEDIVYIADSFKSNSPPEKQSPASSRDTGDGNMAITRPSIESFSQSVANEILRLLGSSEDARGLSGIQEEVTFDLCKYY